MISHKGNSGLKVAEVSSKHFLAWWSYFSFLLPLLCSPPLLLKRRREAQEGALDSLFSDPNSPQTGGHGNAVVIQLIQMSKNLPNPLLSKESVAILCEGKGIHPDIFNKPLKWKDGKRLISIKIIGNFLYAAAKQPVSRKRSQAVIY